MKKILFLIAFSFCIQQGYSQLWLDVGFRAGYGLSMLYNSNIFNDVPYNHQFAGAAGFGGRLGINIGSHHGFTFDVMSRRMKQKFEYKLDATGDEFHNNTIEWKNLDLYLLYRGSSHKVFIEVGPMLSLVRNLKQTDDQLLLVQDALFSELGVSDYSSFYQDKYISAVVGFGGFLVGNEMVSLNLSFRIHYSFQDFISDTGKNPRTTVVEIKSFPAPIRDEVYSNYKKTNPLYAEVAFELNIGLGGTAKASCSNRMHWFWSGNR